MSEEVSIEDEQEVQYVLNESEFVLDSSEINAEGLSDIIYADGTRAILVNGHIIQGDAQTVVLQEGDDISQYFINDENGEILVADEQDSSESQTLDGTEIVQYIETDGNSTEETQVVYINDEAFTIQDTNFSQYQIAETEKEDGISTLKAVKLETQVVDLEELIRQQGDGETAILENFNEDNGYQYAILKDGKLHIQTYDGEVYPVTTTEVLDEQEVTELTEEQCMDLSKITGRNLLTGQTVTLHSYMDKLQKKLKGNFDPVLKDCSKEGNGNSTRKRKARSNDGLNKLLNKKVTLGKTANGKRLVGKIIHVEKRRQSTDLNEHRKGSDKVTLPKDAIGSSIEKDDMADNRRANKEPVQLEQQTAIAGSDDHDPVGDDPDPDDIDNVTGSSSNRNTNEEPKFLIHEKIVSRECFEHIARTLSGLMDMDSVKKKLLYKTIIVKVVEKKFVPATNSYTKNVSFSSGYMDEEYTVNDAGEMLHGWTFVPDSNTKEAIFGKSNDDGNQETCQTKYMESTNLTLMIKQEKAGERIMRVILNPLTGNRCSICRREFRSNLQLRVHINNTHQLDGSNKVCEVCGERFEEAGTLLEHRKVHVEEGKLFQCLVDGCGKFFVSAGRLKRHSAVHIITMRPLECSVCLHRCASESGLKKHLLIHMKPFYCETCGKRFSSPGDLNLHKMIHDPLKYYACDVCKRTFSRHSNLQRHVEIHKGSGELFQCAICGCSYHYMSSLTRHVVQNHIKRVDTEGLEGGVDENEMDET